MKNKQYIVIAPYTIKMVESSLDKPKEQYTTIKYLYCGICGGDYSTYIGRRSNYPISLGHEFIGRVIDVGKNVNTLHEGDYVISDFNYRCGKCKNCKALKTHLCYKNNIQKFSNRGFAQYANVHENYLHTIPKMKFFPKACLIEPLSCVIHACNLCKITPDMNLVINGCGSIGMLFVFYLTQILCCKKIYIIENNQTRKRNILTHFGVNEFRKHQVANINLIIECSNTDAGIKNALTLTDKGNTICIMSHVYGMDTSFIYEQMCKKELFPVFPLRNGNLENIKLAIDIIYNKWSDKFNALLGIYDNIDYAFKTKPNSPFNKQIIQL